MSNFPVLRGIDRAHIKTVLGAELWARSNLDRIPPTEEIPLWDLAGIADLFEDRRNHGAKTYDDLRLDWFSLPSLPPFANVWLESQRSATYCFQVTEDEWRLIFFVADYGHKSMIVPVQFLLKYDLQSGVLLHVGEWTPVEGEHRAATLDLATQATLQSVTAFMFSHCKNVELVERLPKRHEQREAKRRGEPILKYHEIVIDPGRTTQVAVGAGNPHQDKPSRALHIARGHFATYTEDKPLFGKYTGTYWRPAHVRGSAELGAIKSTYKVKGTAA